MRHSSVRTVLLISPPWQDPRHASLALATLGPMLREAGLPTDELHGSLLYHSQTTGALENMTSFLFVSSLYPEVNRARLAERLLEHLVDSAQLGSIGVRSKDEVLTAASYQLGVRPGGLVPKLVEDMRVAERAIDECVARANRPEVDVVGLSATFESQLHGALAIATRLRRLRPDIKLVLGGAACLEEQGVGLAASFPVLDAVCHSEGEDVIAPLVRALRGEGALAEVPGIAYHDPAGTLRTTRRPGVNHALDRLPMPDYGAFFEQLEHVDPLIRDDPRIMFETSRGCWWGQKHKCTFCGLEDTGLVYRKKSAERAYREIVHLHQAHPEALLIACDHILDLSFLRTLLPRLAPLRDDPEHPLRMFFETKSNLRRDQIQTLADGGLVSVQAGIESISDEILAGMDKGATGVHQIQFVKWASEVGIHVSYLFITMNPGDRTEYYREMRRLVPYLEHLPPPGSVVVMDLYRFSECFVAPERYGIENMRPSAYYHDLFPDPGVDLDRVAYAFDFDHPMYDDDELKAEVRALAHRVFRWRREFHPGRALAIDDGRSIQAVDWRGIRRCKHLVTGVAGAVYRTLGRARPRHAVLRTFPDLDPLVADALLDTWYSRRWALTASGRCLAVLPAPPPTTVPASKASRAQPSAAP